MRMNSFNVGGVLVLSDLPTMASSVWMKAWRSASAAPAGPGVRPASSPARTAGSRARRILLATSEAALPLTVKWFNMRVAVKGSGLHCLPCEE